MGDLEKKKAGNVPEQLDFLNLHSSLDHKVNHLTTLVEFFDMLPIFSSKHGVIRDPNDSLLETRTPSPSGIPVIVKQMAFEIEKSVYRLPGPTEQNVLHAIRWLATHGSGERHFQPDGEYPMIKVDFSISMIRRVLKQQHRINLDYRAIERAVTLLMKSPLDIEVSDGPVFSNPLLIGISDSSREHYRALLHPLISYNILETHQLQLIHPHYVSYPPIAQYILNRVHLRFTQVETDRPFNIRASTVLQEGLGLQNDYPTSGPDTENRDRYKALRKIIRACDQLLKGRAIAKYESEDIKDALGYTVDKMIYIYADEEYVRNRITAAIETKRLLGKTAPGDKHRTSVQNALPKKDQSA